MAERGQEKAAKKGSLLGEKLSRSGELLLKRGRVVGGDEVIIVGNFQSSTLNRCQVKVKVAGGAEEVEEVTGKLGWLFGRAED